MRVLRVGTERASKHGKIRLEFGLSARRTKRTWEVQPAAYREGRCREQRLEEPLGLGRRLPKEFAWHESGAAADAPGGTPTAAADASATPGAVGMTTRGLDGTAAAGSAMGGTEGLCAGAKSAQFSVGRCAGVLRARKRGSDEI